MWTPFPNQLLKKFAGKSLNGFDMALMEISWLKKIWFALTSTMVSPGQNGEWPFPLQVFVLLAIKLT